MNWIRQIIARRKLYEDLSEEIESHVAEKVEELVSSGLSRLEAEAQARRAFGNRTLVEERSREVWLFSRLENLWRDLRFTVRRLVKAPTLSLTIILMLTLTVAASAVVFSVLDRLLLNPLPYKEADRLLMPWERHPLTGKEEVSYADFQDWRAQSQTFEDMAAYTYRSFGRFVIGKDALPSEVEGTYTTANLFSVLGVQPILGRNFLPEEDKEARNHVVLLSSRLWEQRFHSDPKIVGQQVRINAQPFTVVGVMPSSVTAPSWSDIWMPISLLPPDLKEARPMHVLEVIGHRKPGVSFAKVRTEMETIAGRLRTLYPITNGPTGFYLVTLEEEMLGKLKPVLCALSVAVGLVLLMTCANIANLLLLRNVEMQKEYAVRSALGADVRRLLYQSIFEGCLLSIPGVLLGLGIAELLLITIRMRAVGVLPRAGELGMDFRVSFVLSFLCIGAVLVCSILPAAKVIRKNIPDRLKEGGRATVGRTQLRVQSTLLAVEISFAVIVLIGTGLLLRSFRQLLDIELGFRTHNVLTAHLTLPEYRYGDQATDRFFQRLIPALQQIPGVESVATVDIAPFTSTISGRFAVADGPMPEVGQFPVAQIRTVSPNYFQTLHIPEMYGRGFRQNDCGTVANTNRILINQKMQEKYFQGREATGRALLMGFFRPPLYRLPIIGVVANARDIHVDSDAVPMMYFCGYSNSSTLLIRSNMDSSSISPSLEKVVQSFDQDLALGDLQTVEQTIDHSLLRQRVSAYLFAIFAGFALLITITGVSAVLSYVLALREKEIAVRIALGATRQNVTCLLFSQTLKAITPGLLVGVVMSLLFTPSIKELLYQVSPFDLRIFLLAPLILFVVAGIAVVRPLRKGSLTNPVQVLRRD